MVYPSIQPIMSTAYPAHASPRPELLARPGRTISELDLTRSHHAVSGVSDATPSYPQPIDSQLPPDHSLHSVPPLISPSFTPPLTPGGSLDSFHIPTTNTSSETYLSEQATDDELAALKQRELDHAASPPPTLTPLPTVTCEVRARIPTTTGQEMFLHLYHNSADNKEHLAIVFGPYIRSKSLDAPRPGETEKDRMIRGAYTGTLYPGRTSSRLEALKREAGVSAVPVAPISPVQAPRRSQDGNDGGEVQAESMELESETKDPTKEPPLVRIHSECYTGETVWSARCDCGEQLDEAARLMSLSPYGGVFGLHPFPLSPPFFFLLLHLLGCNAYADTSYQA